MSLRQSIARYPLITALVFEGLIIPVAVVLALILGLAPWEDFHFTAEALLLSVLATVPLLVVLRGLARLDWQPFRELEDAVRGVLARLFVNARPGAVVAVSLLAGFGEELLFRGVLQNLLAGAMPIELAILFAGIAFGLAHYVNGVYFVVATLVGIYLGLLYHWTGNLLIACLVHALYDWVAIHIYLRQSRRAGDMPDE